MVIRIETIPIEQMRYPTVGDYWYDNEGVLQVRVAEIGSEIYHKMIAIHELVEEALTKHNGIPEEEITKFDIEFENNRKEGNYDEPGFSVGCPYILEHTFATSVELGMCAVGKIDFNLYDKTVNEL